MKAAAGQFAAGVVDELRLSLPPGPEMYKNAIINEDTLISDFTESCESGDEVAVASILECRHKTFLRPDKGWHLHPKMVIRHS